MLLHPAAGLAAVGLILSAYWMKAGRPKFWRLHYWTGAAACAAGAVALGLAVWTVTTRARTGAPVLPGIALVHLTAAGLGLLLLALQVGLGLAMRNVIGGPPKFLRFHRLNARLLAGTAVVVLVLGAATLVMSLAAGS